MTVIRLPNQDLVLISPILLKNGDRALLEALGTVRYLIAPNLFHHLYFEAVQQMYPQAETWGVTGLREKCPELTLDHLLDHTGNFADTLEYLPFKGFGAILPSGIQLAQETVFWHRPSRTLIITDIAFNFDDTFPFTTQLAARVLGSYKTLRPSRLEKWGTLDKAAVEASIRQVLAWDFDRVIPAHGAIVETGGKAQLQAAYEWFLERSL
jgi:hypothetical protein